MIATGLLYTMYIFGGLLVSAALFLVAFWIALKIEDWFGQWAAILYATFILCLILGFVVAFLDPEPKCTHGLNFEWELCK